MYPKSIRWRLQLWLGFLLVCVLTGFCVAVYQVQRVRHFRQIDEELEQRVATLGAALRGGGRPPMFDRNRGPFDRPGPPDFPPPRPPGPRPDRPDLSLREGRAEMLPGPREFRVPPEMNHFFDEASGDFYFVVWSRGGNVLKSSTNAPANIPFPIPSPGDIRTHTRLRESFREAYHFTELRDCVLAGRSIKADLKALQRFKLLLGVAGSAVLAVGLGGGWWLTTRAIRPIEEISAAASRISAGNLSERIHIAEPENELGRLAGVLNAAFTCLEAAFVRQKQFTADASHELRTPVAVLIAETQTTLARQRTSDEYRQTVAACLETAQQMRRLTESLLTLARIDSGSETVPMERIDLAKSVQANVERIRPLAKERGISIHCQLEPIEIIGHTEQIDQVLMNLLGNAIHYNKPSGDIQIKTSTETGSAILTIADTGVGIGASDLPHIFERFYRADPSRSLAQGHTGLGLAICKAIIKAHSGSITASSEPGTGTTFAIKLPIAPS